jgi:hypothetical protein
MSDNDNLVDDFMENDLVMGTDVVEGNIKLYQCGDLNEL